MYLIILENMRVCFMFGLNKGTELALSACYTAFACIVIVDDTDVCCRDYMDRFLDEHESPATLDRVPPITVADCGQQVADIDNKLSSQSQICVDRKPVILSEGGGYMKPCVSNGDSLTVATRDNVAVSSAAVFPVSGAIASISFSDKSRANIAANLLQNSDIVAEDASADSHMNVAGSSAESIKSASVLPAVCCASHDGEMSPTDKMETEAESAAAAAVLQPDRPSSDVDGVASEPSQADASSSATADNLQHSVDSHCSTDHEIHDHATAAVPVMLDAELSSSAEPDASVAAAVDEVKPDDVERLLAAVDSATSVAGSLYSNVDPMTAALEFSSANVSADLPSKKVTAESACQQADGVKDSQETYDQALEPLALPPHSSSNEMELPVSCGSALVSTSCLPADVSSTDVLKQHNGSLACKSASATTDNTHDTVKDMQLAVDEPPVTAVPTSKTDVSAAGTDVLLPDESADGNNRCILHDQLSVSCMNEESSTVESSSRDDNCRNPKEDELASSNLKQLDESCFQSNNISVSLSGPDASSVQMDGTSALHAASVTTDSDSVSFNLSSGDAALDKVGDHPCTLNEAGQSANTDSRSLLTVPSDAEHTLT